MHLKEFWANAKEFAAGLPLPKPRKLHKSDIITIVTSFLCAMVLWVYIASEVATDYTVTFNDLPVTVDLTDTRAADYKLNLLPESRALAAELTVDCTIEGTRTAYGALGRNDLEAYVDFDSNVADTVGAQVLPIRLRKKGGDIISNATLSRSSIELEMDHYETLSFKVTDFSALRTADDETHIRKEDVTFEPSTVNIYGPSTRLSEIDHIRVNIDSNEILSQTVTISDCSDFDLIGQEGNVISTADDVFQIEKPRFSVTIPVYYSRSLPVTVNISYAPANFNLDEVMKRIRLNTNAAYTLPGYGDNNLMITVETEDFDKKEKLQVPSAWTIDSIELSALYPGGDPITKLITMDPGYTNSSNFSSVDISLDASDLTTKRVWVLNSDIVQFDPDSRYQYALQSPDAKTPITLIGTAEELSKIDDDDIIASVRLFNIAYKKDDVYSANLTVTLPDTVQGVWVSPNPTVDIIVKSAT